MGGDPRRIALVHAGRLVLGGLVLAGCATTSDGVPGYRFAGDAALNGPAHAKIVRWQERERVPSPSPPRAGASLGGEWTRFVSAQRRTLAEAVGDWVRAEAQQRYVPDAGGDHWPTTAELFASQGDDCDGLELLALHALRALGLPPESLFRAVIERPRDGVQHMVTLWFETPEDPLVIDPTGFATERMLPLSSLEGGTARAIFTEHAEYRVVGPALVPAGALE